MNIFKAIKKAFFRLLVMSYCFLFGYIGISADCKSNDLGVDAFLKMNIDSLVKKLKSSDGICIPPIHTDQFNSRIQDSYKKRISVKRTEFAVNLLKSIQKYQEGVCSLKKGKFAEKIENLEVLREKTLKGGAYVNYIIVNYLDKVITYNLLRRLFLFPDEYEQIKILTSKNQNSSLCIKNVLESMEKEYGKKIFDFDELTKLSKMERLNVIGKKLEAILERTDFGDTAAPRPIEWIKNLNAFEFFCDLVVEQPVKYILKGFIVLKGKNITLPKQQDSFILVLKKNATEVLRQKSQWRYNDFLPDDFYLWYQFIKSGNWEKTFAVE